MDADFDGLRTAIDEGLHLRPPASKERLMVGVGRAVKARRRRRTCVAATAATAVVASIFVVTTQGRVNSGTMPATPSIEPTALAALQVQSAGSLPTTPGPQGVQANSRSLEEHQSAPSRVAAGGVNDHE